MFNVIGVHTSTHVGITRTPNCPNVLSQHPIQARHTTLHTFLPMSILSQKCKTPKHRPNKCMTGVPISSYRVVICSFLCVSVSPATSCSSLTFSVCQLLSLVLCVDLQAVGSGQHCCMCIHIFVSFLVTHQPSTICAVYCMFSRSDMLELCDCGAAAAHNGMASC